jgi:hypothetical protein
MLGRERKEIMNLTIPSTKESKKSKKEPKNNESIKVGTSMSYSPDKFANKDIMPAINEAAYISGKKQAL